LRHLIFLIADHFEPSGPEEARVWGERYPAISGGFADADGRPPQHTWFYDRDDPEVLAILSELCRRNLGEIEVHLHHAYDTADGLREKLERRKRVYADYGALVTAGDKPRRAFGFIHGKWSLDNSRGDAFCGVNNELRVLKEAGCYADFTFPAWGRMQPSKVNSIYYATDDPSVPKSYDTGADVSVGVPATGDLMIFMGPGRRSGVPAALARVPGLVRVADWLFGTCAVEAHLPPWPERVERWIRASIHVRGRPDWVFVKVHMHGAVPANFMAYFDSGAAMLHGHLARMTGPGAEWRLHYVTAREAYNIVKAAEAGMKGDPDDFRDWEIPPYQNRG